MFLAVSAMSLTVSCQMVFPDSDMMPDYGTQEVGIYAGGARTRTEMLSDGLSAAWTAGDEIALWAKSSAGSYALSNQIFTTYGIDSERGFFTSTLPSAMGDGTYTYMCCYPAPASVDGTKVTFNLPALQDGTASGGEDIMIATPAEYGPLTSIPNPEDHSGMSLKMNRMMHQFRFFVPSDNTVLGDDSIRKLVLTFPSEVVGKITLDVSDPSVKGTLSEATRTLTMELSDPIQTSSAEEYDFAYAVIVPSSFAEGQMLNVRAYTSDMIAEIDPIDLCGRSFEAGHSTPVKLKVKSIMDYPYKIEFTLSGNNLGEDLNTIRFQAPVGCKWPASGSNVYEYTPGHKISAGDKVVFRFDDVEQYKAFSGKTIDLTFDSDHAITSASARISDIEITGKTHTSSASAAVPYLFEEDFSSLSNYDGDYKAGPYTSTNAASTAGRDLSQYGLSSGWTGARTGCDNAGTAILVGGRVDCVIAGATRAYGRLDSPCLSRIKSGVTTGIKVTFDYSGNTDGSYNYYYTAGSFGTTTTAGVINGYATQFNNSEAWSGIDDVVSIPEIPTSGSATSMSKSMTHIVSGCASDTRLSWHVVVMGYKSWKINNADHWIYIDNIKVQIAN